MYRYNPKNSGATVIGTVIIPENSEEKLTEAIATVGPVAVAVDSSQLSFANYNQGVYDEPNCNSINLTHAVSTLEYWYLKAS